MLKIERVQTLQYMGSKNRLLNSICAPIIEDKEIKTVIDLFAGSGTVGYALSPYKKIISNDLEFYAFVINNAILNGCCIDNADLAEFRRRIREQYNNSCNSISEAIDEEERLFGIDAEYYQEYANFSDNTPSVFNPYTDVKALKCIERIAQQVIPGNDLQDVSFPCLFLTYFANAYFGIRQCCQIDAIASQIFGIADERQRYVLLAALMSAMSTCASTTTHFAQFLKVKSKSTFQNIRDKREQDIFVLFDEALERFKEKKLLSKNSDNNCCYNMDFLDCLMNVHPEGKAVVYADPPYFKEHYSRYYHVLNTLCLYDYPELAINPQTKKYSIGRYRSDRNVSDFGKRAKVIDAFKKLINLCADKHFDLVISYSENSLVKVFEILKLAEERYRVKVEKVELKHSTQGRATVTEQKVKEFIIFCDNPDSGEVNIKRFSNKLKTIKPIVDNPAGFIHNYMARKPYNVVSELIKTFTTENETVFDPMFGSGTTLIEASKLGRKAIGCDINPIAYKLTEVSLSDWDLVRIESIIRQFVQAVETECEGLYIFNEGDSTRILERCHFDFVDGNLIPVGYWYKDVIKGKLSGRKKGEVTPQFCELYYSYDRKATKRLKNKSLIPNSRIAIKEEYSVFDYFCNRNLLAMDRIFEVLDSYKKCYGYEVLEILVSSSINLIKLSDKKASSQMPYWLPQNNVTSRNACLVISKKAEAVLKGLSYLNEVCRTKVGNGVDVFNEPAQSIDQYKLKPESVDLVLTDPPYTDQVPYLEYNQLWFDLFGIENEVDYTSELVVSDAPSRNKDNSDFNQILSKIIGRCNKALKPGGLFVMFYHTFDLKSWANILRMMRDKNFKYLNQIPTASPRKSFKTIMSPRSTLDGNYLLFFEKEEWIERSNFTGNLDDAISAANICAERIIRSQEYVTTQDLYDNGMLKEAFEYGYLELLAEKFKTFVDVIKNEFDYIDGYWEVKK